MKIQTPPNPPITFDRDLTLKLHIGDTVVSQKLTIDQALGVIGILNFLVRDLVHAQIKPDEGSK